jgi:hypothetical protein
MGKMGRPFSGPQAGHPVVVGGNKYRIRRVSHSAGIDVSLCPGRNTTHVLMTQDELTWDGRARVWRPRAAWTLLEVGIEGARRGQVG